jgi:hypothetical protein
MPNGLKAHEKEALTFQLGELLEHDEPAAFLATLLRLCERQAFYQSRRDDYDQTAAWQALVDTIARVKQALERSQKRNARPRAHVTDI